MLGAAKLVNSANIDKKDAEETLEKITYLNISS